MIPRTIDEAIQELVKDLSVEEQIRITKMSEDDLSLLHHSLGQWMRNTWRLWEEEKPLTQHMISLGFTHADDMSGSIIREFWSRMNNKPSTITEDVEKYKEYWDKQLSQTLTRKSIVGFTALPNQKISGLNLPPANEDKQ